MTPRRKSYPGKARASDTGGRRDLQVLRSAPGAGKATTQARCERSGGERRPPRGAFWSRDWCSFRPLLERHLLIHLRCPMADLVTVAGAAIRLADQNGSDCPCATRALLTHFLQS